MKILVLGDIHGRLCWNDIIEKETYDKVIFLGDYVSTHENISSDQQLSNLEDILNFKEQNSDKVILLRGNHDLQHLGYYWAKCSGLNNDVLKYMSEDSFKERFLSLTQWIYRYNDYIFSHAGISQPWLDKYNIKDINDINSLDPDEKFGFSLDDYYDRYGTGETQPLTWIRPQTLCRVRIQPYIQIVGHTPQNNISIVHNGSKTSMGMLILCDTLPKEYLILEDNKIEVYKNETK